MMEFARWKNQMKKKMLAAKLEELTGKKTVLQEDTDLPLLASVNVTSLEHFDAQLERAAIVAAARKHTKKVAPSLSDSYRSFLQQQIDSGTVLDKFEWSNQIQASLEDQLTAYLQTTATASWRGRGLPLPPAAQIEKAARLSARQALATTADIRNRFASSLAGNDLRQSPEVYLSKAGITTESLIEHATDRLYDLYEQEGVKRGVIQERVWRNGNPATSRHRNMEGQRRKPGEAFSNPDTGRLIKRPRPSGGAQKEWSNSSAVIKYILSNGKEV